MNGLALHGGFVPYGSTFLVFRLHAAGDPALGAGTPGNDLGLHARQHRAGRGRSTHQPVEHYAALRAIPDLHFIRPGDANETVWAWRLALEQRHRPTALALTRQNVPTLDRTRFASAEGTRRGAYVLNPDVGDPQVALMATGSEVHLIVAAEGLLARRGIKARLVSMPCWQLFDEQSAAYRDEVLPPRLEARLAVEAGSSLGWHRWIGSRGDLVTLDHFGASAPAPKLMTEFGFTAEQLAERAARLVS